MYATELTKDYLIKLGITDVSRDGKHIICKDKELTQQPHKDGYLRVVLYDPDLYKIEYKLTKKANAGQFSTGVHRIVYCWFKGEVPSGYVIDHINNIKDDNRIDNLQLLTPQENIMKGRGYSDRQLKCKLNKPLSFYENKLNYYLSKYEEAKLNSDAKAAHKCRANIWQCRARIRYYKEHMDEAYVIAVETNNVKTANNMWRESVKMRKVVKEFAQKEKLAGRLNNWHNICKFIRNYKNTVGDYAILLNLYRIAMQN